VEIGAGKVPVSADMISELSNVLDREKFRTYVSKEERGCFSRSLLRRWSRSGKGFRRAGLEG
jgi:hypothetical protein